MSRITCAELLEQGDRALRECNEDEVIRVGKMLVARVGDPLAHRLRVFVAAGVHAKRLEEWARLRTAIADRVATAGS
jgi:hypothetical protein